MEGARVIGLHLPVPRLHGNNAAEAAAQEQLAEAAANDDATSGNGNGSDGKDNSDPVGSSNGFGADEKVTPLIPSSMPNSGDSSDVSPPMTMTANGHHNNHGGGNGNGTASASAVRLPKVHEEVERSRSGTRGGIVTIQVKEGSIEKRSGAPILSHTFNSGMYRKQELRTHELLTHLLEVGRLREIANKERAQAAGVVGPLPSLVTDASGMLQASSSPGGNNNNGDSASGGASASGMDTEESSAAFSNSPAHGNHTGGNGGTGTPRAGTPTGGMSMAAAAAAAVALNSGRVTPPMHPRMPMHTSHHSMSNLAAVALAAQKSGGGGSGSTTTTTTTDATASSTMIAADTPSQPQPPSVAASTGSIISPAAAAVAAVNFVRRVSRANHDSKTPQSRAFDRRHPPLIHWIQIPRADRATMQIIGKHFKLGDKQVDDVLALDQLPSVDGYDNNLTFVFHMQGLLDDESKGISVIEEQMTVIFVHEMQTVISVNESAKLSDCFERILAKLSFERSKIRLLNDASFLCYSFVDAVVDYTFPILEKYARRINWLEKDMLSFEPTKEHMDESGVIKTNLLAVRMNLWRLRELLTELIQDEYNCISTESKKYMRDVYIHTENMVEVVESQLELCGGLLSIYNNDQGTKTNSTVAVLTNLTDVLLPAQFITGVYGMNFDYLPEKIWEWSYLMFWVLVITIGVLTGLFLWWQDQPMKRPPVPQHLKESGKMLKRRASVSSIKIEPSKGGGLMHRHVGRDRDRDRDGGDKHESKRTNDSALVLLNTATNGTSSTPTGAGSGSGGGGGTDGSSATPSGSPGVTVSPTAPNSSGAQRRPLMIGAPPAPLLSAGSARMLMGRDRSDRSADPFAVEMSSRATASGHTSNGGGGGGNGNNSPSPQPNVASRYEVPGVVHEH